jgi:uncharacterized protein (TIGR02231 family)
VISGFPTKLKENTFRACVSSGSNQVKILEVSYSVVHPEESESAKTPEEENVDKIKHITREIDSYRKVKTRLEGEEAYLANYSTSLYSPFVATKSETGPLTDKAITLDDATAFLTMYRNKLVKIKTQKLQLDRAQADLQEQLNVLRDLTTHTKKTTERREVAIEIRVSESCQVALDLSYIILGALWTSSYDVRVDTEQDSLTLMYFGSIVNDTEEDWKDVNLTLSTAEPAIGGFPPPIFPLSAQYYDPTLGYSHAVDNAKMEYDDVSEEDEDDHSVEMDKVEKMEKYSDMKAKKNGKKIQN